MYYSTTYLSPLGKITLACDACGKNLVGLWLEGQKYYQGTLIIPCHRVVGANGSLTGYAGGIEKKIKLLELEGVDMSGFFIPQKGTAL